jgi:hypothetical protein
MELTEFRIAVAMGAYWKTVTNKQESIMQSHLMPAKL